MKFLSILNLNLRKPRGLIKLSQFAHMQKRQIINLIDIFLFLLYEFRLINLGIKPIFYLQSIVPMNIRTLTTMEQSLESPHTLKRFNVSPDCDLKPQIQPKTNFLTEIARQRLIPRRKRRVRDIDNQTEKSKEKRRLETIMIENAPLKNKNQQVKGFGQNNEQFQLLTSTQNKKYMKVAQILSYIYNQFRKDEDKDEKKQVNQPIYEGWEIKELENGYHDTNVGDFILMVPNPDFMKQDSEVFQMIKKMGNQLNQNKQQSNQDKQKKISLVQALQKYDYLFDTEHVLDKYLEECEKIAFKVALSIMYFENCDQKNSIIGKQDENMDKRTKVSERVKNQFAPIYRYYKLLNHIRYDQYNNKIKEKQFRQKQYNFASLMENLNLLTNLSDRNDQLYCKDSDWDKAFQNYRESVHSYLRIYLYEQIKKSDYILLQLVNKFSSISSILFDFPEIIPYLESRVKLFQFPERKGGYLTRRTENNQIKWFLSSNRPPDLLTLLRNFLIYKLTIRAKLFTRTFISKDENYIYIVIKGYEQHLQKMAEEENFMMQLQLGAVDIFSFEPVDQFGRPLRCNDFLRNEDFIQKYNLLFDKSDEDQLRNDISVQSQSLQIYKKSLVMNQSQLRAKMILDQNRCDEYLQWLCEKLRIKLIRPEEVLDNQYNKKQRPVKQNVWNLYYIYNKVLIEQIGKLKHEFQMVYRPNNKEQIEKLETDIGLYSRLIFLKALNVANNLTKRMKKGLFKPADFLKTIFIKESQLVTIWKQSEQRPRGYYPYFFTEKMERIWRKYEINESMQRSKFTPSDRLIITNHIVKKYISITKSIKQNIISDYFPIHDPYILKNIKLRPYFKIIDKNINPQNYHNFDSQENLAVDIVNSPFIIYECEYTMEDFTKESIEEKLSFKWNKLTQFSIDSVAFYCGQKIAYFFEFRRFLAQKSMKISIFGLISQIFFWIENQQIIDKGISELTVFNNYLSFLICLINILWVDYVVSQWKSKEESLSYSFGTQDICQHSQTNKRILFQGKVKRKLQTDEINYEYENKFKVILKAIVTNCINILFVTAVTSMLLLVFVFKDYLHTEQYSQQKISIICQTSISILTVIFNIGYEKVVKVLVNFQNRKTTVQFENSLIVKRFTVNFIVTFSTMIIYTFFTHLFDRNIFCLVKTKVMIELDNCYYHISRQAINSAFIDLLAGISMALLPLLVFLNKMSRLKKKRLQTNIQFNQNFFQSIDEFYEQQNQMNSFMYTDQIDKTWEGYNSIVVSFAYLALFSPIAPFLYFMMLLNNVVKLHTQKYQIIFFSRRVVPVKVKSIGIWLEIVQIISHISVPVNIGLVIYVRNLIGQNKGIIYISLVFSVFALRFIYFLLRKQKENLGKRIKRKVEEILYNKSQLISKSNKKINTDISNVQYDQSKLKRYLPEIKHANIIF